MIRHCLKDLALIGAIMCGIMCMQGGDIVVRSAGPDRLFHTDDDITNGAS